ncbi:MAG TPA: hypothetical protein VME41_08660 [Stellaceae bacterium]|nr:hypothetical protein [Stellaceae bacterium]
MTKMWRIALSVALLPAALPPAFARMATVVPPTPYYAMEPTRPLTPTARSPVQQQILENYRIQLLEAQHDLSLQAPSGLGPARLQVNRQLNAMGPGAIPLSPAAAAPAPSFNPTPFAAAGALPAAPFDAAPAPVASVPR